jgi:O-antigen/teichoic acid export membrane protein
MASEAKRVFVNTGALAGAQLIERIANAILLFVLARALGADGLGVYAGALAYYALIAVGGQLGATSYLVREVSRQPRRASEFLVHLGIIAGVACTTVAAVVVAVVPFLGFAPTLAAGVMVTMAAVVPGALAVLQEGVFIAYQKAHIRTVVTFLGALFNVGATLAVLAAGYGAVAALTVFAATQFLVTTALFFAINRWLTPIRSRFRLATARRMLRDMKEFIGSSLLGTLFSRPEIIILTLVASEAQVGYYAGALKLVDLFAFVPATFAMSLFPVLSRSFHGSRERLQEIQDKAMRFMLTFAFPVSVATLVLGPELVELAYGNQFEPAVVVLRILAMGLVLHSLFELLWRVLSARDQQGVVLRVQAVTTVTRLGGGVVLAILFAAVGAAASAIGNVALHVGLLGQRVRRDGTRLNLLRLSWRPALASAVMGGVAWVAMPVLGLFGTIAVAAVLYLPLAVAVGALSVADLELIWRRPLGRGEVRALLALASAIAPSARIERLDQVERLPPERVARTLDLDDLARLEVVVEEGGRAAYATRLHEATAALYGAAPTRSAVDAARARLHARQAMATVPGGPV